MHVDTRLSRGDRVRLRPGFDPDWPDDPPGPIWELVCEPRPADDDPRLVDEQRGLGLWHLHIRYVTPGTTHRSAVGEEDIMLVRMEDLDYVSRASEPGEACEWECL